jgi:hypothetical protein
MFALTQTSEDDGQWNMPWRESERLARLLNGYASHPDFMHTGILLEQSKALGRIEVQLDHHGERLTSLETRATATEARPGGAGLRITLKDAMPFLWGLAILAMAGTGVLDWKLAASVLPRF